MEIIGRKAELEALERHLGAAKEGRGSLTLLSGQAGIGKTRLVEEFANRAAPQAANVLRGASQAGAAHPFSVFSRALASTLDEPIFEEREKAGFAELFAVNKSGILLAKASADEGGVDPDIFAGMLSAVQDFVRDSFDPARRTRSALGRLEFGDMKVIIEHGAHMFLIGVVRGAEHPDMRGFLRQALQDIEGGHGDLLANWKGKMSEMTPVAGQVARLFQTAFLVTKELKGEAFEKNRLRIAEKVLNHLIRTANGRPLLVLLEDLQWADESSLVTLAYLARNVVATNVMLVGTYRPGESAELEAALVSMRKEGTAAEIALDRLSAGDIADMVAAMCPDNDFPGDFLDGLAERCGGTPLFVVEFMRHMMSDGTIRLSDGRHSLTGQSYSIPDTVEGVILGRLERLSHQALTLAEYAACAGREFPAECAAALPGIDAAAAYSELAGAGIIDRIDGTIAFSHAMFPEVMYSSMPQRWKRSHHRGLGEYYETAYLGRTDMVIFELARHFHRAGEHHKASVYCMQAGEKAESAYAPLQALSLYENALDSLSRTGAPKDSSGSLAALEKIGDMKFLTGKYAEANGIYAGMAESAASSVLKARMLRKCSESAFKVGDTDGAFALLARAKEALAEEGSAEYAGICAQEAFMLDEKGKSLPALELLGKAYAIIRDDRGELNLAATMQRWMGRAYQHVGDLDKALACFGDSLRLAEAAGDIQAKATVLNAMGTLYADQGEFDLAIGHYKDSLSLTENTGDIDSSAITLSNLGNIYFMKGELESAIEFQSKGLELKRKLGRPWSLAASLLNLGVVYLCKGDIVTALRYYEDALGIWKGMDNMRGMAFAYNNMGELHLLAGDAGKALDYYGRSLELREKLGDKVWLVSTLCGLAQTRLETGEREAAMAHAGRALELSLEMKVREKEGISRRVLGAVQREAGDAAAAEQNLEAAITILMEVRNRAELAIAMYERSKLLAASGKPAEAKQSFENARSIFEAVGMRLWADKTSKAMSEL